MKTPDLMPEILNLQVLSKNCSGSGAGTVNEYSEVNMYRAPEIWQKAVQSVYYGKYILSSVYTRGGTGDRSVIMVSKDW